MKQEIEDCIIDDTNAPVDPETGLPLDGSMGMDMGQPIAEPDLEGETMGIKELPKGGEI